MRSRDDVDGTASDDARRMDRRAFLATAGILAALVAARGATALARSRAIIAPLGLQLYTVRSLLDRDADGTLAAVAAIGYREVELAGLHGRTPRAMRALLDRHGLVATSSHVDLARVRRQWTRVADEAHVLGQRFIVVPWIGEQERSLDGYRRVAADLDRAGEAAERAGLRLAYHNHDFELARLGDTTGYDVLLAETDPALVAMEMDIYWIAHGGRDPLALIAAHPGRFPLVHLKDMARGGAMADVGAGTIDFPAIAAQARAAGIEHWFVERDDARSPLESARVSYEYARHLE